MIVNTLQQSDIIKKNVTKSLQKSSAQETKVQHGRINDQWSVREWSKYENVSMKRGVASRFRIS